jgi:hypothetical protein
MIFRLAAGAIPDDTRVRRLFKEADDKKPTPRPLLGTWRRRMRSQFNCSNLKSKQSQSNSQFPKTA